MKILHVENSDRPNGVEIRALMGETEFKQLLGYLDNLCVFATRTCNQPAKAIRTGARASYSKWLLFPAKLRKQFKTDEFDFGKVLCSTVSYREKVYVVYEIPKRI